MGDERELGRLEAKVDIILQRLDSFVTKAEYEPRITALERNNHKVWDKMIAFGTLGSMIIGLIALFKAFRV